VVKLNQDDTSTRQFMFTTAKRVRLICWMDHKCAAKSQTSTNTLTSFVR